jgi:serine phosphatase RsbU (regulator of sigma subunit)/CheY-like chemotaxis protein/anti-sigma regulatory factor (Ser/Thr protein kinase)
MAAALKGQQEGYGEQPLALPEPPAPRNREVAPASILIVDDDEKSLRALELVLEPLGQNVVSARSGEEALRWLLREEFAVILLDMRMPGLDGMQTARYINARARTRHIPIVFLTAHSRDVRRVFGAHAAGAVDYVAKPFDPDVLRSKVAVFVELHNARAEHVHEARARAEAEGIASTVSKLQSISDAALAHLDLRELIPELLRRAASVFDADAAGLLLRTDDDECALTVVAGDSVQRIVEDEQLRPLEELLHGAADGAGVRVTDLAQVQHLPGTLGAGELRSLIAAPLTASRKAVGMLFLAAAREDRFGEEDVIVLDLGAERAAFAVEHALSYERERGLVELLQDHLLPDRLPLVPGLAMAARYRPSERLAQVGGDWYDAISLPGGRLGLVIGDVVGHGVGAATMMAELRAALRAYAIADPSSPAATVSALNALVAATHGRMVATLLYLVVDGEGTSLRYASAGHPPPAVLDADGGARFLAARAGPPLGALDHTTYSDHPADLAPGSTLLLYTDGLIERRGEVIDAGLKRLADALADAPSDLEELCAYVLATATSGSVPGDDTALLGLRRLPRRANVLDVTLPAEPRAVSAARHRLRGWLSDHGCTSEQVLDITLAANEACTNAVEHAYGPAEVANFRLMAECSTSAVVVRVCDQGDWRQSRGVDRGRGLHVISELMDDLEIKRMTAGTTVEMTKARGVDGDS